MSAPKIVGAIAFVLLSIAVAQPAEAADLTVAWDPPSDGLTAGFVLYYGTTSHTYSQQINVGATMSYTVSGLASGTTYYFAVRAYDASGDLSDFSAEVSGMTDSTPVTALALTSSLPSPQLVGTTVMWSATPTGGVSPFRFQWSVFHAGQWVVGAWTSSPTWTWTPIAAGNDYTIRVAVLSAGSTSTTGDVIQTASFIVTAPTTTPPSPPPASPASVSLTTSLTSPQQTGTTINWSARASGGAAPYQFKWWVNNGSTWSAATAWTTSSTFSWKPGAAGSYVVRVWVRSAGNSADAPEGSASVSFTITKKCQGKGCK